MSVRRSESDTKPCTGNGTASAGCPCTKKLFSAVEMQLNALANKPLHLRARKVVKHLIADHAPV
jgi:hypothetical protein